MAGLTQVAHWDEDAATNAVSDVESEARAAALREVAEWRDAVVAVVNACDIELEGGAATDFERGADAAYNWVLSVIDGKVQAAARAILTEATGASE